MEKKYKTEDAGLQKFAVDKFMDYKMIDSKLVSDQIKKFENMIHGVEEGHSINESFQVAAIIGKLPPAWKDKHYLKHKGDEFGGFGRAPYSWGRQQGYWQVC